MEDEEKEKEKGADWCRYSAFCILHLTFDAPSPFLQGTEYRRQPCKYEVQIETSERERTRSFTLDRELSRTPSPSPFLAAIAPARLHIKLLAPTAPTSAFSSISDVTFPLDVNGILLVAPERIQALAPLLYIPLHDKYRVTCPSLPSSTTTSLHSARIIAVDTRYLNRVTSDSSPPHRLSSCPLGPLELLEPPGPL